VSNPDSTTKVAATCFANGVTVNIVATELADSLTEQATYKVGGSVCYSWEAHCAVGASFTCEYTYRDGAGAVVATMNLDNLGVMTGTSTCGGGAPVALAPQCMYQGSSGQPAEADGGSCPLGTCSP
jgi:hypothetical protein